MCNKASNSGKEARWPLIVIAFVLGVALVGTGLDLGDVFGAQNLNYGFLAPLWSNAVVISLAAFAYWKLDIRRSELQEAEATRAANKHSIALFLLEQTRAKNLEYFNRLTPQTVQNYVDPKINENVPMMQNAVFVDTFRLMFPHDERLVGFFDEGVVSVGITQRYEALKAASHERLEILFTYFDVEDYVYLGKSKFDIALEEFDSALTKEKSLRGEFEAGQ